MELSLLTCVVKISHVSFSWGFRENLNRTKLGAVVENFPGVFSSRGLRAILDGIMSLQGLWKTFD